MIGVLGYYFIISFVNMIIFIATAVLLVEKYSKKNIKLYKWAAIAFAFLALQEFVVLYWIFDSMNTGYLISMRPWHLQALAVFFSFNLLGLSMIGKVND